MEYLFVPASIIGQIAHIVKKRTEEGRGELSVLRQWVLRRPINTLISCVGGVLAAYALQVDGMTPLQVFFQAFAAGFAADSLANRKG